MTPLKIILTLLILAVPTAKGQTKPWKVMQNCKILTDEYRDGDSFKVLYKNKKIGIRLYFVDCPESHKETRSPDRVLEQAEEFHKSPDATQTLGDFAADFTLNTLKNQPFTVITNETSAMGSSLRYYGFVRTGNKDLGELLLKNGLARLKGFKTRPPFWRGDQTSYENLLTRIENEAKNQKKGIWKKI